MGMKLLHGEYHASASGSSYLPLLGEAFGLEQPGAPSALTVIRNGDIAYLSGRYSKALTQYRRALRRLECDLDSDNLTFATCLNRVSQAACALGLYSEAEIAALRALALLDEFRGEPKSEVVTALNNLGGVYQAQGMYERAERAYLRALARCGMDGAKRCTITARTMNNLGMALCRLKRSCEAIDLFAGALQIFEDSFEGFNADIGITLNNIGAVYDRVGYFDPATQLYLRANDHLVMSLGTQHPYTVKNFLALSRAFAKQGRTDAAESLLSFAATPLEE